MRGLVFGIVCCLVGPFLVMVANSMGELKHPQAAVLTFGAGCVTFLVGAFFVLRSVLGAGSDGIDQREGDSLEQKEN